MTKKLLFLFAAVSLQLTAYAAEADLSQLLTGVSRACNKQGYHINPTQVNAAKVDLLLQLAIGSLAPSRLTDSTIKIIVQTSSELDHARLTYIAPGFYSGELNACDIVSFSALSQVSRISFREVGSQRHF